MQTRDFFFSALTRDSSENSSMKLEGDSSSLSSGDGSQSSKILTKRVKTETSPVSFRPWKKPRTTETKYLFSSTASSSKASSSNSRVVDNAFSGSVNVSINLCLVDKSWGSIKTEEVSVSCAARNLQIREAVNISKLGMQTNRQKEQEIRSGISTELNLFSDPWVIKKKLTESDLGHLSRLIISKELVDNHVLKFCPKDFRDKTESKEGVLVWVWDHDTDSMYQLKFKRWVSSRSYVLNGDWRKEFVKRRTLSKGDEIGLYWDPYKLRFNFTVLQRASASSSNMKK